MDHVLPWQALTEVLERTIQRSAKRRLASLSTSHNADPEPFHNLSICIETMPLGILAAGVQRNGSKGAASINLAQPQASLMKKRFQSIQQFDQLPQS